MTLRERFARERPGRFFLDGGERESLEAWLLQRGWIAPDERVLGTERAGEGNMNCTLRVHTGQRSFILKQARPWVEKYPVIEAPDERAIVEADFYKVVRGVAGVASRMPALLASDENARMLMIEDLAPAHDCTDLYTGARLSNEDLKSLTGYLEALRSGLCGADLRHTFANRAMRALNHEHIFALPIRPGNGLNLDAITPGLDALASELKADTAYCRRVTELGEVYLVEGSCLVHGDFFPGSWIRCDAGLRVIDPEFCFFGVPEFDFGMLLAHLQLAGRGAGFKANLDSGLLFGFAGVEIMRRLIGVAQLPVRYGLEEKQKLLELSRKLVLQ